MKSYEEAKDYINKIISSIEKDKLNKIIKKIYQIILLLLN